MKKLIFISIIFLVLLVQAIFVFPVQKVQAFNYVLGTGAYPLVSVPKPAKGTAGAITDPDFHTTITRITDKAIDGYPDDYLLTAYDTHPTMNSDDTLMLLSGGEYYIYGGPKNPTSPYQKLRNIPIISSSGSAFYTTLQTPIWSTVDPNKLYVLRHPQIMGQPSKQGIDGNTGQKVFSVDARTGAATMIHDFTNDPNIAKWFTPDQQTEAAFNYISWEEYGEPSKDMKIWAFNINHRVVGVNNYLKAAVIYRKDDNDNFTQIGYTEDPTKIYIDNWKGLYGVSASGRYSIYRSAYRAAEGFTSYAVIRNSDMAVLYHFNAGHMDMAVDAEGRDVIAGTISAYGGPDYFSWMDLEDGTIYGAIPMFGEHSSGHCWATPGWWFVNTYAMPSSAAYSNEVIAIELNRSKAAYRYTWNSTTMTQNPIEWFCSPQYSCTNGTRVWQVAHHHIYTATGSYNLGQAHGAITMSGNYFIYAGWWETDSDPEPDVYQIALPPTWYQDLSNITPDTTSPAAPTGVTVN